MHAVAFFYAVVLQRVGELADLVVEVAVGEHAVVLFGIVGFPDDGGLVAERFEVAVDAVFGDVEAAVDEPAHVGIVKIPFGNPVPFFMPGEGVGDGAPESVGVLNALLVSGPVLG